MDVCHVMQRQSRVWLACMTYEQRMRAYAEHVSSVCLAYGERPYVRLEVDHTDQTDVAF